MYINITNGCPCDCVFCIRRNADSIEDNDSLWLEHEPSFEEITAAFEAFDKQGITEAVFCGYGEPTVRIEMLLKTAEYIKANSDMRVRINTNGLLRLMPGFGEFDLKRFKGLVDCVSVSLNAPNAKRYNEVTQPSYGEKAFDEMIAFAKEMKEICDVAFTVVDVITDEETGQCKALAEKLGIPLRVRHHVTDNGSYT